MKKEIIISFVYVLAFILIIANTVIIAAQSLNPDINDLPQGKLIKSFVSPQGSARIDIYLVDNNLGKAIRGEYVSDGTGKTFYWQTDSDSAEVNWVDEQRITINDMPINASRDKYDSRRGTAIFTD